MILKLLLRDVTKQDGQRQVLRGSRENVAVPDAARVSGDAEITLLVTTIEHAHKAQMKHPGGRDAEGLVHLSEIRRVLHFLAASLLQKPGIGQPLAAHHGIGHRAKASSAAPRQIHTRTPS